MELSIRNQELELTVDTMGAQMLHLRREGIEYLWQADPAYWAKHAPNLFPFIGRLWEGTYRFHGTPYTMGSHGFAAKCEFTPVEQADGLLVLELKDSPETRAQYPFAFSLRISYRLTASTLHIGYTVQNLSEETMPFGIGGHPGFRVPLCEGERFEDYALTFSQACLPDRVGCTPSVHLSGRDEAYPLTDGSKLPLEHTLFDDDAIILKNMDRTVTLSSHTGAHGVTVAYPQMSYLGIWHKPKTDAPYVCIEPWTSLPARENVIEELSCKSDLVHLEAGKTYENNWSVTLF